MSYRKYLMTDDVPPSGLYKTVKIDTDSDTISRAKAIEAIDSFNVFESRGDQIKLEQMIGELPPAQPEIIRCKDCKYAEYIDDVQTLWCTECGQGRTVAPDDYCSYAEREVNNESN